MDDVQYIWADPSSPQQQVALSSIVQAMNKKHVMAIARWVSRDGMDPKMGVFVPALFDKVGMPVVESRMFLFLSQKTPPLIGAHTLDAIRRRRQKVHIYLP